MLKAEQENVRHELESLVSVAELKEKRARKRAVWYTVAPIALGLVFLGASLYSVTNLKEQATNLNQEIASQTLELNAKKREVAVLDDRKKAVETHLALATATLRDIGKGEGDAQQKARQTLQVLTKDTSVGRERENTSESARRNVTSRIYDGSLSLDGLGNRIEVDEANLDAELISLVSGVRNGVPVNIASFREKSPDATSGRLKVVPVEAGGNSTGRRIFQSAIYVEGQLTRVVGLR